MKHYQAAVEDGPSSLPGCELGPVLLVLEGFSSSALETHSKSFEFLLIYVPTFSRAAVSSDLWLAPSTSLIFCFFLLSPFNKSRVT